MKEALWHTKDQQWASKVGIWRTCSFCQVRQKRQAKCQTQHANTSFLLPQKLLPGLNFEAILLGWRTMSNQAGSASVLKAYFISTWMSLKNYNPTVNLLIEPSFPADKQTVTAPLSFQGVSSQDVPFCFSMRGCTSRKGTVREHLGQWPGWHEPVFSISTTF